MAQMWFLVLLTHFIDISVVKLTFEILAVRGHIWATMARHLLSRGLNTGSGGIDMFLSKVKIWNVNCARVTTFTVDSGTDVLVKVSKLSFHWFKDSIFKPLLPHKYRDIHNGIVMISI